MNSLVFRRLRLQPLSVSVALATFIQACSTVPSNIPPPVGGGSFSSATPNARVDGTIVPAAIPPGPVLRQSSSGAIVGRPPAPPTIAANGDISLNYVDTDIRDIARLILGDVLKLNYTIEPGFMGAVTIQTPRPIRREDLLGTFQTLLSQIGGAMIYDNGVFRLGSMPDDTASVPLVDDTAGTGTQIVTLRYASARQLAMMLEAYVGEGARLAADNTRNILIITGSPAARRNLLDLVRVFDVDYLAAQSYALFPAKTGGPVKYATDLQAALQLDNDSALAGAVKIVPIDQANAIMVIAQQPAYLDRVTQLIAQLEQVQQAAGRNLHVYFLKNVQAADIQPLLQRAVNPPAGGGGDGEIAPGNIPPTAQGAQIGGAFPGQGPMANAQAQQPRPPAAGLGAAPGANGQAAGPAQRPGGPAPGELGQQAQGANAQGPQIIADRSNSALVVVATESEYATIEAAIRKLDILPMQVLIEATVAEVTLNDMLQYGTQFYLANHEGQVTLSNAVSSAVGLDPANPIANSKLFPGTLAPNFPGFAVAHTIGSMQFVLEALKGVTDVDVVSAPKLLVLDKEQATIQVGDLVPTITQSAVSVVTAGAPVVNNVQYQPTGVILTVTPRINSGGLVTLDIEQEVSDVVNTTSSSINSPTFQQRRVKTKVVVQDGETISLAGLISDKRFRGNSGIPLLAEIPVLGSLFSTRTKTADRTELLVLLTPRVVYDQHDARALTEELRRKLAPSAIVP
jgi:general secretion pathway protein D